MAMSNEADADAAAAAQAMPDIPPVADILKKPADAPKKEVESCGTCYFARGILSGQGMAMECRREAPKVFMLMVPGSRGVSWAGSFPPTKRELWCGEWAPKKD